MSDTLIAGRFAPGRFDRTVWLVMAAILLIIAVIIWRGDQVGLRVVTIAPAPEMMGISPRSQLRIRFDQPLDEASLDPSALVVTPSVAGEMRAENCPSWVALQRVQRWKRLAN
jgi:hypothetical protein